MTEKIQNIKSLDPFAEPLNDIEDVNTGGNYVHLRIQQRNGRKTLTTIQGLPSDLDQKKLLKAFKKVRGGGRVVVCVCVLHARAFNFYVSRVGRVNNFANNFMRLNAHHVRCI